MKVFYWLNIPPHGWTYRCSRPLGYTQIIGFSHTLHWNDDFDPNDSQSRQGGKGDRGDRGDRKGGGQPVGGSFMNSCESKQLSYPPKFNSEFTPEKLMGLEDDCLFLLGCGCYKNTTKNENINIQQKENPDINSRKVWVQTFFFRNSCFAFWMLQTFRSVRGIMWKLGDPDVGNVEPQWKTKCQSEMPTEDVKKRFENIRKKYFAASSDLTSWVPGKCVIIW